MKPPPRVQLTPCEQILEFAEASADRVRITATMEVSRAQEVVEVLRKFLTDETAKAAFEESEGDVTGAYQIVTNWRAEPTASSPTGEKVTAVNRVDASGQTNVETNPAHEPYLEGLRQAALHDEDEWLRILRSVGPDVARLAYYAFDYRMNPRYMVAKAAIDWLTSPSGAMEGRVPLEVAQNRASGSGAVQMVLRRIANGSDT
jgi:hypothetical protein